MSDPVEIRLAAAKLWLVSTGSDPSGRTLGNMPYLATAVYSLITVPSSRIARLSADERFRLYVNPDWIVQVDVDHVASELAHLVWHLLYEHADRGRSMDVGPDTADSWRLATDICIGETLTASELTNTHLPWAQQHQLRADRTPEEHYAVLSGLPARQRAAAFHEHQGRPSATEDADPTCGSACDGVPRDYEFNEKDAAHVSPMEAQALRARVAVDYRGHITTRGTEPGELTRWIRHVNQPVVPWRQVLSSAVRRSISWAAGQEDFTYARRSRRQAATPQVILPGMHRPVPNVALVVDTSGSVDDGLLAQALAEVDGALTGSGVPGAQVSVVACDAAVHAVSRVRSSREVVVAGGGGTDLRVGIAAAVAGRPRPDVVVVLTDGYTPWPTDPPVRTSMVIGLLARTGDPLPPTPAWARRVECLIDA